MPQEQYIGEIRMLTCPYAPAGWSLCDGSVRPIQQDDVLATLLGKTYGGDGETTYAVPKLEPYQGIKFYISHWGQYPAPA
jgi:microcystin-dependent protein